MSIRNRRDATFLTSLTLPAAGSNDDSASIDLESAAPGTVAESIELEIAIDDLPNLADDKNATVVVYDSADDSTFAEVEALASVIVTGAGGAGAAGKTVDLKLPSSIRRYIRINGAVDADGGDNTAAAVTMDLLF
ncbi:hypothetical protein QEH52_01740 [Coraliomargarita sp. SDUM461003]|uniref:Uncharacterized protein n=1 Tax=Thalassobacterium maritimum TaxID=3041265 RepID=A0ABU1ASI6_9BACT|nr:hypothetical protein [Coraliomargarita sp. SDUM461003]MDQ8206214.1 hypothetical protein [Coraliomargarita sp. SDUM461003]